MTVTALLLLTARGECLALASNNLPLDSPVYLSASSIANFDLEEGMQRTNQLFSLEFRYRY